MSGVREELSGLVREALEMSSGDVQELADEAGVSSHTVWAWAAGRRYPSEENRRKLAGALKERGEKLGELASRLEGYVEHEDGYRLRINDEEVGAFRFENRRFRMMPRKLSKEGPFLNVIEVSEHVGDLLRDAETAEFIFELAGGKVWWMKLLDFEPVEPPLADALQLSWHRGLFQVPRMEIRESSGAYV